MSKDPINEEALEKKKQAVKAELQAELDLHHSSLDTTNKKK